jgi:Flp pilus assembly protein TadG
MPRSSDRGAILVLFTLALVVLLLVAGLVVDLGVANVTSANLGKAVDAGALTGVRHSAKGIAEVEDIARRVAAANYGPHLNGASAASYSVAIDRPGEDTMRVVVNGTTESPTFFAKLLGKNTIDVAALAEATRFPVDLSLLLDLSYSLKRNDAFDDMQDAVKKFIDQFDDTIDQLGMVGYSTWAHELLPVRKSFRATAQTLVSGLAAISDTNIEEGLRLSKAQLDLAPRRESSLKLVVLFTDGRPTAFADAFRMDGPRRDCPPAAPGEVLSADSDGDGVPDCYNGAVATPISGSSYRGLFRSDNGLKAIRFAMGAPIVTANTSRSSSPVPLRLPGGGEVNGVNIRSIGMTQSEDWANEIRAAGYTIYAVGLGNPNAVDDGDKPDLAFLRRIANEQGIANGGQPRGEMLFASTPADLERTFTKLADRILTRLTQ